MQDKDNEAYVREVHDKGLAFDLGTMNRRRMLGAIAGAGALGAVGASWLSSPSQAAAVADDVCVDEVPSETAGPYPADGSNGPQVRTLSGVVRSDIRSSFGTASGVAGGIPLTFSLVVQDLDCAPIAGAAVYAWQCDREGRYSLYSSGVTNQNYLRGIQVANAAGVVTFQSIYPGCYAGRWPHIHFEVFSSLANATSNTGQIVKTSQIALPKDVSQAVYATTGYSQSVTNLSRVSLSTDMVFRDDLAIHEMATVSGNVTTGYTATLTIGVNA